MVRWCIRLTRLTLVCEVIRDRLVQVHKIKKRLLGLAARKRLSVSLPLSFSPSSYFLSFSIQKMNFFEVDQTFEMLQVPLVTIMARSREIWLKTFWSPPRFGDVASAASRDNGAANAIETFWSRDRERRGEMRKKERSLQKRWTERWMINNSKIVDWTKSVSHYQMSIYFCFPKKLCERREMDRKMEAIERSNWTRQK